MFGLDAWLVTLPPALIFIVVGAVIGLESMGIPLPGELTVITAALLAVTGGVSIWGVAISAAAGAIVGDSIGFYIGHRGGSAFLLALSRRFPRHLGPEELERAERIFARWGVWAVFFGRFVALLRILAGPLAGALRVPYRKFLVANASGGIVWAFTVSFTVYFAGHAAERYLKDFSWVALLVAIVGGVLISLIVRHRTKAGRSSTPSKLFGSPTPPRTSARSGKTPSRAKSADGSATQARSAQSQGSESRTKISQKKTAQPKAGQVRAASQKATQARPNTRRGRRG